MTNKLAITTVPLTESPVPERRRVENRGEMAIIVDGQPFCHLKCLTIKKGHSRGGHYHKKKMEQVYLFSGKIRITWLDLASTEKGQAELGRGQKVKITPQLAHVYEALEDSLLIEYCNVKYDVEDDVRFALTTS